MHVDWNRDFLLLYNTLLKRELEDNRVRGFTEMHFTADNFINMFVHDMLRRDGVIANDQQLRRLPICISK